MQGSIVPGSTPVNASGKNLRKLLYGAPPNVRARAAAKFVTGEWQFTRPLPVQAARLCRVTSARVNKALGRSPRPRSDRAIDKLIIKLGAGRVMAALDRLTSPT